MTRTALLIGVARTPGAPDFDPLEESVAADLAGLREALESSKYDVRVLENPGRAQIGATIFELAKEVPEDGTFLVYFTGHGVRLDGIDYLLPADALAPPEAEWSLAYRDSLQPSDISRYLEQCRAGTVLWLIDACRDEVADSAFGSHIAQGPPSGGFAVMVGCDPGERCGYSAEGSFFTRGLIEAFSSVSAPRSVHEVYEASRSATARLAAKSGLAQHVKIRYGTDREEETRQTQICAGRHLMDKWRAAVTDEGLWGLATPSADVPRLQEHLLALVDGCARRMQHAEKRLPDPWADDEFPARLLGTLPKISPDHLFSAVEIAALTAAVFLREGAWAGMLSQAADTDPCHHGRIREPSVYRRHLEQVHDQYSHIARKLSALLAKDRLDDRHDVGLWLVHRWIAERFDTDETPIPNDLATTFALGVLGPEDTNRVKEFASALCRLAAGVGSDPAFDGAMVCANRKVVLPGGKQPFRERSLVALLRLAGVLAVDARVFPEVVAEHLAVSDPVSPAEVVSTVRRTYWSSDGTTLDMDAVCPHQALHAGLEEVADRANRLAAQTRKLTEELPGPEASLLARIPITVTTGELRPEQDKDKKAYEVPLLRFRLAQNEVRDLLMGKQLYGSPDLALRELFQNAMDACRYRAMRWQYLRRLGKCPVGWEGRISIVQGEDERGRYVDCRDNGVGMSWDQLINTFTRAGSRFEQSRLFRQEQASWLRFDSTLRLHPNSRFGIGVFSYFMLADEMTIVTRPVSRDGVPAQDAWRVEISSSGSLFRILKHNGPDDGLTEGGTRVRLYLRDDDDDDVRTLACTSSLRELIAVSEFHLEVRDTSGSLVWEPGVLYPERAHKSDSVHEAVPGVLWWTSGVGAVLCDGIVTDQQPFGYVLNLTGVHAGELSVNRNQLISYDLDWERQTWGNGALEALKWPGLTMSWLWSLDVLNLPVAQVIWQEFKGKQVQLLLSSTMGNCDLDSVGVASVDMDLMDQDSRYREPGNRKLLQPWRSAVLRRPSHRADAPVPISLVGYPVPQPGDTGICCGASRTASDNPTLKLQDWTTVIIKAQDLQMTVSEVVQSLRRSRIAHPTFAPPRTLPGSLDWHPHRLDREFAGLLAGHGEGRVMDGPLDLRDLVAVSCKLRRPLGELIDLLPRYTPLRLGAQPEVPPPHRDYICTDDDLSMLYLVDAVPEYRRARSRWTRRVTRAVDVREAADRSGTSPEAITKCLGEFSWLGWIPPDSHEVDRWMEVPEDAYRVLRNFCADGKPLNWTAAVVLAGHGDLTLREAQDELVELSHLLGIEFHPRCDPDSDWEEFVPSVEVALLFSGAREDDVDLTQSVSLDEMLRYLPDYVHLGEFVEVVSELAVLGVSGPPFPSLFAAWDDLPLRTKYVFSGTDPSWEENDFPSDPSSVVLFTASAEMREPLKEVWRHARAEAARFGMPVPALPKALAEFRPGDAEIRAVVSPGGPERGPEFAPSMWKSVTMFGLARYARDMGLNGSAAYERLASLRPLGALVTELSPAALQVLEKSTPDKRDLLALEGTHRVTKSDEPLLPLDLVSIAARLGEPISDTWQRFVPYLPLTVEPAVSHFPDVIPYWQDLAILTKYLDGLLPAIEGRVDPGHVEFVAHEVGEPQEWVWGRLKLYETMFDLDLSDMPEEL